MWLPTPVYKRIPQFWIVMGLMFVANGLYLGLDIPVSNAYVVIGIVCCIFGVGVAVVRSRHRRNNNEDDSNPPATSE